MNIIHEVVHVSQACLSFQIQIKDLTHFTMFTTNSPLKIVNMNISFFSIYLIVILFKYIFNILFIF